MSTRSFVTLAVSAVAVGGLLGGLFIGGYELGKRNAPDDDLPTADLATLPSPGGTTVLSVEGAPDEAVLSEISQALGSGQLQGNFGGGGGGGLAGLAGAFGAEAAGGGVFGTIEARGGQRTVTLATPQGTIKVSIDGQTDIQGLRRNWPLDELETGATVTVTGQRDESGGMSATSVFVLPEGASAFGGFGGGGFGGRGFNFGQRGGGGSDTADDADE